MELKHVFFDWHSLFLLFVLIVPSGIETNKIILQFFALTYVLIVPSGIETAKQVKEKTEEQVLIVPSGIETLRLFISIDSILSINCT